MALVAYDSSDASDYEEEDSKATVIFSNIIDVPTTVTKELHDEDSPNDTESINGPSLFNLLPQPSASKPIVFEEDDEFLHKKDNIPNAIKPKAKITVPSLSDFKDVKSSVPNNKPKTAVGKKSGLLSILPQPKNGFTTKKSLIPNVLTKTSTAKKKAPLPSLKKKAKVNCEISANENSDSDNDDDVQNDFFSINKPVEIPAIDEPFNMDEETEDPPQSEKKPFMIESYFKQDIIETPAQSSQEEVYGESIVHSEAGASNANLTSVSENIDSNEVALDDEAIMKLVGARGKRKREDIQIVDVNQQEVLANAREWLLKGLMNDTSKRVSSSKKKGNEPTSQQRRKHQITYLAHQAKANEADLQNQWANSRMSRRQTQSKYGF